SALARRRGDIRPPSLTVMSPTAGGIAAGQAIVSGYATDNRAVARVAVSVDGGTFSTASGTTSWSEAVDTTTYPNGTHVVTVKVQDTYGSQVTTSASGSGGQYTTFHATIYLKGTDSGFAARPDASVGHEYGHAWTLYHLYISKQNDWSSYLAARGLTGDSRLD